MSSQTYIFFGIVGSGKGTQAKLLRSYLGKGGKECVYVGTGEIFRKILDSSPDGDSGKQVVREMLFAGKLMPDETTNELVKEALESEGDLSGKHIIFDGYPRTVVQSEYFLNLMAENQRSDIKIIYITLSEEEAMKRNLERGRHDDTKELLEQRFAEYRNKVIPSMQFFSDQEGYEILEINGEQSVEEVHQGIIKALGI